MILNNFKEPNTTNYKLIRGKSWLEWITALLLWLMLIEIKQIKLTYKLEFASCLKDPDFCEYQ